MFGYNNKFANYIHLSRNIMKKNKVGDSSVVQVGDLIGMLALPGEDWKTVTVPDSTSAPVQAEEVKQVAKQENIPKRHVHPSHDGYLKIMPGASILIKEYQIDPSSMTEIGPRGFISKRFATYFS